MERRLRKNALPFPQAKRKSRGGRGGEKTFLDQTRLPTEKGKIIYGIHQNQPANERKSRGGAHGGTEGEKESWAMSPKARKKQKGKTSLLLIRSSSEEKQILPPKSDDVRPQEKRRERRGEGPGSILAKARLNDCTMERKS